MKNIFLTLSLVSIILKANSQQVSTVELNFHLLFGNKPLVIADEASPLVKGDSIRFSVLRFYISGIQLFLNNSLTYSEQNSFHLIDAEDEHSMHLSFSIPGKILINKIKFNLGIDSLTNVFGAMGGDLDPTKGMYWTWQSGYINFKIEGNSFLNTTRNQEFQFHLGGYKDSFNALQVVMIDVTEKGVINIYFDTQHFIGAIDLKHQNHIMSPGKEAVHLSELAAKSFYIR